MSYSKKAVHLGLVGTLLVSGEFLLAHPLAVFAERSQQAIADLAARAEALEAQGQWETAAAEYRKILQIDPRSVAALNALGALSVKQGKFKEGISYYDRALKLSPREFGTNLNLGIAYIKIQDYKSATAPLEKAAEITPTNFQALELLAVALIGQDQYTKAIPRLQRALELDPRNAGSCYLLIRSYIETKQFEKALDEFQRLETLDAGSPWVRILRGQAYDGAGAYEKALEEFEAAKKRLPSDATVRFSLGFMCWKLRRLSEAESELLETLRLDPHFTQAKYYLADTYLMDLKPELALPVLQDLVRELPKDYRGRVDLGKALEKLGRYEEAVPEFQEAIRLGPTHAEPHYLLARTYQKQKRVDDFHRELQQAQRVQAEEHAQEESLVKAIGARGDPARGMGLVPPPERNSAP
jgi:tetratricopeptide (TPR) repeat protein